MSVTNLRRTGNLAAQLAEGLPEGRHGQLEIGEISDVEWTPAVSDHPFADQRVYEGTALYHEPSEYTAGRDIEVTFELRTGSQLILVESETDLPSIDDITAQLRAATGERFDVYRSLHAPEDALWDFLTSANRVLEITVLDDGLEVPYQEVDGAPVEEVIGEYAISRAQVSIEHDTDQMLVTYRDGTLQVESDWDGGRDYIIDLFEREVLGA